MSATTILTITRVLFTTLSGSVYTLTAVGDEEPTLSRDSKSPMRTDRGYADMDNLFPRDPKVQGWTFLHPVDVTPYTAPELHQPRVRFFLENDEVITTSPVQSMVKETFEREALDVPTNILL